MYGKLMYSLYKIPSWKVAFYMLYYRQKEEGWVQWELEHTVLNKVIKLKWYSPNKNKLPTQKAKTPITKFRTPQNTDINLNLKSYHLK